MHGSGPRSLTCLAVLGHKHALDVAKRAKQLVPGDQCQHQESRADEQHQRPEEGARELVADGIHDDPTPTAGASST